MRMRSDTATSTTATDPSKIPAIVVDDVHVTYKAYEDRRPTLRQVVTRRFRPRPFRRIEAVRGVSFSVMPGETVGIIGRNGSGKSTLLRSIGGLLPPDRGTVHTRTNPVLLAVGAALKAELSGRRNIYLGASALGLPKEQIDERIDDIIEFTGLGDFIDLPLKTYSSGMGARLKFGAATVVTPDILLIDEALATGDAEFARRAQERIDEIVGGSGTVIVVAHTLSELRRMCDRVIWIDAGRIVMDGESTPTIDAYREEMSAD